MKQNFMIYGSYGYSGNLIAEYACSQGLKPVLGGRNKDKLQEQATRLGLEYKQFDLDNVEATKQAISPFITVIHCAGPFIHTYKNMAQACLDTHTHYMDITGEYTVIELLTKLHEQARAANIMLLPGAGFDVVPSDCLAQYLKSKMPEAVSLTLAIHSVGARVSRGTARTFAHGFSHGTTTRVDGVLNPLPLGAKKRVIDFGDARGISCTTISWGDLASAWWSTQIPNIETYMATTTNMILVYRLLNPIKPIFQWPVMQRFILNKINKMPEGPSAKELERGKSYVYGEVKDPSGKQMAALLTVPNGYKLTAMSAILIVKKTLEGRAPIGFQTPSTAYGQDLILEISGCKREDI